MAENWFCYMAEKLITELQEPTLKFSINEKNGWTENKCTKAIYFEIVIALLLCLSIKSI